ncbi:FMN-binding protein [Tumebacillus permanentifrigoris]|uniref:Uncharacterized protein with FMN-binding domain n=1 Tax=Tumebacillus permanentifrigoris TaxID=378543 RepID=A0A316DIJ5_9BACL|nr:FMN-binding protein [Tumebacillus permanentifrigoris]PWK16453.1 uncharacterized protein with FMN-binding domain [Tumebacillus permanentifrigoris]
MGAKKADKLAALCSAAIGVIYVTGYFVTDPALAALATQDRPAAVAPTDPNGQNLTPDQNLNPNQTRKHGNRGQNFGGQIPEQGQWQDGAEWPGADSNTTTPNQTPKQPSTSQGQTTSPAALSGTYKDGTYTGSGTNRIGTVEVAVTIASGKITAVEITNCNTHYPQSRIDKLPAQILKNQSDQVNNVSGATMSTTDFRTAVRQALQQAQA